MSESGVASRSFSSESEDFSLEDSMVEDTDGVIIFDPSMCSTMVGTM